MTAADQRILETALRNQQKARQVIETSRVVELWEALGMEVRPVGSLPSGLLMKHRDIDFHIYSDRPVAADGLTAMQRLAGHIPLKRLAFNDLLGTGEDCLEYHAWVLDEENELWQLDMIHIRRGSFYDGWFEKVTERIAAQLTPETRLAILKLKNATPESEKIMGIEYYQAVLRDGVRDYADFLRWRREHPVTGIVDWMP